LADQVVAFLAERLERYAAPDKTYREWKSLSALVMVKPPNFYGLIVADATRRDVVL